MYCKIFHLSYGCTFTWFCLLRYIQKREFYFYFIAFCAQVLLTALDHNMHSFRPQATTKNGHLIFKKQYSNRTKHGHPEPVRAEKTYDYIQFLMASILKARVDDKDCCKGYFSSIRSPKESGPNHNGLRESPELMLSRIIEADLAAKKSEDSVKPVYCVLIRDPA